MPRTPRHATGTIRTYRRADGGQSWQAVVKYPDPDDPARWRQRSRTFSTRAEAKAWLDAALAEHRAHPQYRAPSTETLGAYLDRWLAGMAARVRPTTHRSYRFALAPIRDALGDRPLATLTPLDLQAAYARLSQRVSARTVAYTHSVLRHALADAEDWGLIPGNPARRAKPPRPTPAALRIPTEAEARALLRTAEADPLYPLWALLAVTGLRHGEALGLRWEDIDWDRQTLIVRRTLTGTAGRRMIGPVKTRHGQRVIALDPWLARILRAHHQRQRQVREVAGAAWQDTGYVFTTRRGTCLDPRNVQRRFKAVLARAGLPPTIRIHDLRHAMATAWLAAGVNPKVVSERLGHASIAITLQLYGHALPTMQAEAARERARALLDADGPGPDAATGYQPENREGRDKMT